jgi:formate dehydrogenase maturation protein FdhE
VRDEAKPKSSSPERIAVDEAGIRELVGAIAEAIRPVEGERLFETFPDPGPAAKRQESLEQGAYLFQPAEAVVSPEAARKILRRLLGCLMERATGQSETWEKIEKGLAGNGEEPARFLHRILQNDARAVLERAGTLGVTPDTLSFLSLFWARPFRAEAARKLLDGVNISNWRLGYCPACGHWPSFGYLPPEGDRRNLRCAACSTTWRFDRIRCPFCLETEADKLPYFTVDDDESLPVYVCEECRRYLKHRREEKGFPRQEDLDFVLTAPLDYVAASQGYIQESLVSVRFDEPDGETGRAYRAKARYEEGASGPNKVH